jgi:two-component system NtrC family sensor kinase
LFVDEDLPMDWMIVVLLLVALAAIVQLWLQLRSQRRETASANFAVEEAQRELDRLQAAQAQTIHVTRLAALGQMVVGIARDINVPIGFAQNNIAMIVELLEEYRSLVQRYDLAVQHCLQPVDLLFSADKASLDKLVKYVEEARRKLFEARADVESSALPNNARQLLTDSGDSLQQLSSRVQSLKDFARSDTDAAALVDVGERIDRALALAQPRLHDRIEVVKQVGPLPKVRCTPTDLDQVFLSLITNAALAIEAKGKVTITAKASPDQIEVAFEDDGSGMADNILPKIFEPFFSTRPAGEGTGLGLTIAHKIITGMGGTIRVKTTPRQGSVFTVTLPVGAAAAEAADVR